MLILVCQQIVFGNNENERAVRARRSEREIERESVVNEIELEMIRGIETESNL